MRMDWMLRHHWKWIITLCLIPAAVEAQQQRPVLSDAVRRYVTVDRPVVALTNVRIIDGTGRPPLENQTIIIAGTAIQNVGPAASVTIPRDAEVLDLSGRTIIPGIVGMHEHLYFSVFLDENGSPTHQDMRYSFPRLYLAAGVTTIRTAGAKNVYSDLNLKNAIDAGVVPGLTSS